MTERRDYSGHEEAEMKVKAKDVPFLRKKNMGELGKYNENKEAEF